MEQKRGKGYEDMMYLPHHVSATRPRMSMATRAAQFSPFAALTGYDASVKEASRLTDRRIELDEYEQERLNEQLALILEIIGQKPLVTVTYFEPDERKAGGSYVTITGQVKKVKESERTLLFADQTEVPIEQIVDISFEDSEWAK